MDYYATLGPACNDYNIIYKMMCAGMTGVRLNLSHGDIDENECYIENIKKAENKLNKRMKILIDLKGPELRTGKFESPIKIVENTDIIIGDNGINVPEIIFDFIEKNQEILLDDGKILLKVKSIGFKNANCYVLRGGVLNSNKSITIPNVKIYLQTLSESDKYNISKASKYGVNGIMLPFVRNKKDLICLKNELKVNNCDDIKIFSKIEDISGLNNIQELIDFTDTFVIARGDLGNSMNLWELPAVQKDIAKICNYYKKDFMIVTQMLDSMHFNSIPTRAEVLDIFNAVLDGANSIMLTGETAIGKYPIEAMKYFVNTGNEALDYILKKENNFESRYQ